MKEKGWMNNKTTIYHIFLDRFAGLKKEYKDNQSEFCGGNLNGIIEKLDFIQSMGFNAIWISPFYETSAYHGYHITDFDRVDPRFGTLNDLKLLIHTCHLKGMRIIADIVPNHCSNDHRWFREAFQNPKSNYRDWFYFNPTTNDYLKFLGFSVLPKLNLENPKVAGYMLNSLIQWAALGFDGFRIDHIVGIPDKFLMELRQQLLKINPDFVLIGEAWVDEMKYKYLKTLRIKGKHNLWKKGFNQTDMQNHYTGIVDGVLDFGWRDHLLDSLGTIKKNKGAKKFKIQIDQYNKKCTTDLILPRFLDNHDTDRIMYSCHNNELLFKNCLEVLMEQSQPIIIYYGTEFGLSHDTKVIPEIDLSDLAARKTIPWGSPPKFKNLIAEFNHNRSSAP